MRVIIDIHVHTRSKGHRYDAAEVAEVMRLARRAGVGRAVQMFNLMEPRGEQGPSEEDVYANNTLTMEQVRRHPDFYIGFCFLNPANDPEFCLSEIERTIANGNLSGIKFWAWVKANDPCHDPLLQRAAELNVPILYHSFYNNYPVYNESSPAEIAELARRHPIVPIIMAHLGGAGWRGVMDIKYTTNVVVDTSGGPPCAGLIEYAVEQLGAERVVFGSDWPPRDFTVAKARVMGAKITDREKAMIMGENAMRILRLDAVEGGVARV